MGWIRHPIPPHFCDTPQVKDLPGEAKPGSVWQCDDDTCKKEWMIVKIFERSIQWNREG